MVQEETLCVLVKEAFGLSEERHLFYDDYINRGLGNKPPAKVGFSKMDSSFSYMF